MANKGFSRRRTVRLLFCFILITLQLQAQTQPKTSPTQAQTGVIAGQVTDGRDREPLIGATVIIDGGTVGAVTDTDGHFRIDGL
ncbi:MAG: carboxypeptidase-like regulatory domain-containing protein, partial [Tannerellaceae bacterium]|nr:carboxypeptidase-like regulatory domain-containing protein [Tannerellaceae bacterium]